MCGVNQGSGVSLLVRAPDSWSKGCKFSTINFVCWLIFGLRSTPVLLQWHVKDTGHLPKVQVAGYTNTCIHPWPNEVRVGWLCCCPGMVWEPIWKRAHMQLIKEHSATIVSACRASVGWSWHKEWNQCAQANLHFKEKKRRWGMGWLNIFPKLSQVRKKAQRPLNFPCLLIWRKTKAK